MNLCVDIGNSRVKIGLFQGKTLKERRVLTHWTPPQITAMGRENGAEKLIFSSVADPQANLPAEWGKHFQTIELLTDTPLPFENKYRTPHTLGKDRLAAVAGAQALFPGENCCVIDCGTCIKYELLLEGKQYIGGNIAPGAGMRIRAMHHFTARLPEVAMEMPEHATGDSTESALQNGALRGACLEMEGFVRLFEQKYPNLKILLTGGDADFFYPYLNIQPLSKVSDLTLHGLNHILEFNLSR